MTNLYSVLETNTNETLSSKQTTKKIDILFDLEADKQTILDAEFDKNIICVCGSCDLLLEGNEQKEAVTLNNHKVTINLKRDIKAELKNCTSDARVVVQYFGEIYE